MAGFDQVRWGLHMSCLQRCPSGNVSMPAHDGRAGGQLNREKLSREPDGGALATRRIPALQWRSALVSISIEARVLAA